MLQVISFPTNPVTWDAKNSPYMKNNIIGLSMRASGNEDESLPIKNLKEKVDIYMPMQKAQPQTKNITFEPGKSQHYMYQLFQVRRCGLHKGVRTLPVCDFILNRRLTDLFNLIIDIRNKGLFSFSNTKLILN